MDGLVPARTCSSITSSTPGGIDITTSEDCSGFALSPWLGVPLSVVVFIAPFIVRGLLLHRARNRAAAES